jgi:POT family proton-dependent oligopeptide transporter
MMGGVFLSLSASNFTLGRLGGFYEAMGPAKFWMMNAAIAATGGVLAYLLRPSLERLLNAPTGGPQ